MSTDFHPSLSRCGVLFALICLMVPGLKASADEKPPQLALPTMGLNTTSLRLTALLKKPAKPAPEKKGK